MRERHTSLWERNTDWLPPVCALAGDGTHNVGVCPGGIEVAAFGTRDDNPTNGASQPGLSTF